MVTSDPAFSEHGVSVLEESVELAPVVAGPHWTELPRRDDARRAGSAWRGGAGRGWLFLSRACRRGARILETLSIAYPGHRTAEMMLRAARAPRVGRRRKLQRLHEPALRGGRSRRPCTRCSRGRRRGGRVRPRRGAGRRLRRGRRRAGTAAARTSSTRWRRSSASSRRGSRRSSARGRRDALRPGHRLQGDGPPRRRDLRVQGRARGCPWARGGAGLPHHGRHARADEGRLPGRGRSRTARPWRPNTQGGPSGALHRTRHRFDAMGQQGTAL